MASPILQDERGYSADFGICKDYLVGRFFYNHKKSWKEIGLSDEDLLAFQIMLLKNPESGPVMEGTGGNNMNSLLKIYVQVSKKQLIINSLKSDFKF